jgi:hypothetical protein
MVVTTEPMRKTLIELAKRDIRIRGITDITRDNISNCKMMLEDGHQLRHLPGMKSNFEINDRTGWGLNTNKQKKDRRTSNMPIGTQ